MSNQDFPNVFYFGILVLKKNALLVREDIKGMLSYVKHSLKHNKRTKKVHVLFFVVVVIVVFSIHSS